MPTTCGKYPIASVANQHVVDFPTRCSAVFRATNALALLERRYGDAGIDVRVRAVSSEEIRDLPTTWAQKLAIAGRRRPFVEVSARQRTLDRAIFTTGWRRKPSLSS